MSKIAIHVGLPKTATTTLQQKVFAAHPDLVYLGTRANHPQLDQVMSALCSADNPGYDASESSAVVAALLSGQRGNDKPVVVSHEAITGHGRDRRVKAERLKALFPGAAIVLTVRRPEDMVVSMYFQWLKGFGGKRHAVPSIDAWLEHDWGAKGNLARLQYEMILDLYRSLFGRANVLVLFFEDLIADRAKFARQLSEFIGVDAGATERLLAQEKSNPRMSSLRYSEVRLYSSVPVLHRLMSFKRFIPASAKAFMKSRMADEATQTLSPQWRQRIRDYAREQNPAVAKEFTEMAKYDYF